MAPDLDPWGVCAPPWALNVPQKIPPSESAAIWIKTIVSSNDEMCRKSLAGSALEHLHATPNVCPEWLRPKWLDGSICNIPPSESDNRWLNGNTLAGSLLGRNESAIGTQVYCWSLNPQNFLHPPHWILMKWTVKYLDGISDGLGCVSQHRNWSTVVVSSRNPQNNKVDSPPTLEALNIKS